METGQDCSALACGGGHRATGEPAVAPVSQEGRVEVRVMMG